MSDTSQANSNVRQAVPFFAVANMERSLRHYVEGLGFGLKLQWAPKGRIEWCWLERGGAALMLQEFHRTGNASQQSPGKNGEGVSICFICDDALALYHEFSSRGISAAEPFVGNRMWVTEVIDPDGYKLFFESSTEVPEETKLSQWLANDVKA